MRNGIAGTRMTVAQIVAMTSSALVVSSFLIKRVRIEDIVVLGGVRPLGSLLVLYWPTCETSSATSVSSSTVNVMSDASEAHSGGDTGRSS